MEFVVAGGAGLGAFTWSHLGEPDHVVERTMGLLGDGALAAAIGIGFSATCMAVFMGVSRQNNVAMDTLIRGGRLGELFGLVAGVASRCLILFAYGALLRAIWSPSHGTWWLMPLLLGLWAAVAASTMFSVFHVFRIVRRMGAAPTGYTMPEDLEWKPWEPPSREPPSHDAGADTGSGRRHRNVDAA